MRVFNDGELARYDVRNISLQDRVNALGRMVEHPQSPHLRGLVGSVHRKVLATVIDAREQHDFPLVNREMNELVRIYVQLAPLVDDSKVRCDLAESACLLMLVNLRRKFMQEHMRNYFEFIPLDEETLKGLRRSSEHAEGTEPATHFFLECFRASYRSAINGDQPGPVREYLEVLRDVVAAGRALIGERDVNRFVELFANARAENREYPPVWAFRGSEILWSGCKATDLPDLHLATDRFLGNEAQPPFLGFAYVNALSRSAQQHWAKEGAQLRLKKLSQLPDQRHHSLAQYASNHLAAVELGADGLAVPFVPLEDTPIRELLGQVVPVEEEPEDNSLSASSESSEVVEGEGENMAAYQRFLQFLPVKLQAGLAYYDSVEYRDVCALLRDKILIQQGLQQAMKCKCRDLLKPRRLFYKNFHQTLVIRAGRVPIFTNRAYREKAKIAVTCYSENGELVAIRSSGNAKLPANEADPLRAGRLP